REVDIRPDFPPDGFQKLAALRGLLLVVPRFHGRSPIFFRALGIAAAQEASLELVANSVVRPAKVALGHLRAASAIRSNPTRTMTACGSICLMRARRSLPSDKAWRPKDDFAPLKALCFAEGKTPIRSQRSGDRYGSVHLEFFIARNVGVELRNPAGQRPGDWNSASAARLGAAKRRPTHAGAV